MNRVQADELIEIVKGDASLRFAYFDGQGNTCFIGGIAVAKGFEVDTWIEKCKAYNLDTVGKEELVNNFGEGVGANAILINEGGSTDNPIRELVDFLRVHFFALGITIDDARDLQSTNDKYPDREDRHAALISHINDLVT